MDMVDVDKCTGEEKQKWTLISCIAKGGETTIIGLDLTNND